MQGKYHWSNYYKRAEILGLSIYLAIAILLSIIRPFSLKQHLFLVIVTIVLFYCQKIKGYIPEYFYKYIKLQISGSLRTNQKYKKPV